MFYTCYSLIFRHEGIKKEFQKLFTIFRQFLIRELRYAMDKGVIKDQPEEEVADLIITLVEGKGVYHQIIDDSAWAEEQHSRLFRWIWDLLEK